MTTSRTTSSDNRRQPAEGSAVVTQRRSAVCIADLKTPPGAPDNAAGAGERSAIVPGSVITGRGGRWWLRVPRQATLSAGRDEHGRLRLRARYRPPTASTWAVWWGRRLWWAEAPPSLADLAAYARAGAWTNPGGFWRGCGTWWLRLIGLPVTVVCRCVEWTVQRPGRLLTVLLIYVVLAHTTPGRWLLPWPTRLWPF